MTPSMTPRKFVKPAAAVAAFAAILLAGMLGSSPRVKATDDDEDRDESRIHRGLEIAPVPLNLEGKNRALVALGTSIVNAHVPCNECSAAGPPISQFLPASTPHSSHP